ncbi:hypothetical protein M9H77_03942 [Catharanthus roseus]|uniref:Uncharacterized protein n=1 Tax=Catharanthus roseus TaxID=4058 RepID=A0ACC0CCP4_CATRO|nr:hypothetical protein M9H77_03942 [Catharanthus roseus]
MERIHVSVRARPLSPEDAKSSPWRISENSIYVPNQASKFEFDRIFREESKTAEVYNARTKDIVAAAVRGFNGTVFAYGQTSSGKTHTMRGSASEPGVIPLAVHDLFNKIQEEVDREFLLRMSYMEIYNEDINDLLAPEHRKLQIHESIERGIFVAGLREEIVASPDQVLGLMEFGESHRHIGETNMNLYSSRSHTIFRMIIESREKTEDADVENSCDAVRVSVLNLVDLAGSERAAKTGAEGVRLKEGSHINKSLMTLGTVIKKLSEGVESQGGHVPYRDSKLTRILQPALGGNANTAIICNITLAQVHADETKSSLQFSSRALRVTNCVHVNEILTDAALLKRQKKEIEELRAKLLGSHSEHFEDEILNLRNALLKAELERERIALELEEEKKAQAEREKRLLEQAKKIENLSTMVLCSNRNESHDFYKKEKRRDTWCPGNLSKETLSELYSTVTERDSRVTPGRTASDVGPLLPFEELVNEVSAGCPFKEEASKSILKQDSLLPKPSALLHVTSRRKAAPRKKSLEMNSELAQLEAEYEDLLLKFETERTMSEIQLDYLKRRLAVAGLSEDEQYKDNFAEQNEYKAHGDADLQLKDSEAILIIKQLQDKITRLEMEKSSSQKNLDSVVELATEQTVSAKEKYEELYAAFLDTQEEVKVVREQLHAVPSVREVDEGNFDSFVKLLMEIQELMLEVDSSSNLVKVASSDMSEVLKYFSALGGIITDFRTLALQTSVEIKSVTSNYEKLKLGFEHRVSDLEGEKSYLLNQSLELQNQIQELNSNVQTSTSALLEFSKEYEIEKSEFLSHIQALEKELASLSSCSFAREKESLRKELEKTKTKLRDTESKLKNSIQEKTKLEGEKACVERENKFLRSQKAVLERDISKRDSVVGKRCDSAVERSSNVFEPKRGRSPAIAVDQEEYKRLEVLAFEMETTIASLEDELAVAHREKDEAISQAESLSCELHSLSEELNVSNLGLATLQEEVSGLKSTLEECRSHKKNVESSMNTLVDEKDELAMQLTDALLLMEEEKAIWSAKEKASVEAIEEKAKSYNTEVTILLKEMSEVKEELQFYMKECKVLEDRLTNSEQNLELEMKCSAEKLLEINQLREDLRVCDDHGKRTQEKLNSQLELLSLEHQSTCEELERLQTELDNLKKEREDLLTQCEELKARSVPLKEMQDQLVASKEKAKLRMKLRYTQIKLDTFRYRHKEAVDEMDLMNRKYEAASAKLKDQLASYGVEVLNLKKQLAAVKGQ